MIVVCMFQERGDKMRNASPKLEFTKKKKKKKRKEKLEMKNTRTENKNSIDGVGSRVD